MAKRRRRSLKKENESGIPSPCLSDEREKLADWLELCALKDKDGNASIRDLIRELDVSGSFDAFPYSDSHEEKNGVGDKETLQEENQYEAAADEAFLEITKRLEACGSDKAYPFNVDRNYLIGQNHVEQSVYVFLLLLSTYGHGAGKTMNDGAKLFEEICAQAAEKYMGENARSMVFGFPRRVLPKDFRPALDSLCHEIGEGKRHKECKLSRNQKDAKLDVVAWRPFPDNRPGKSLAFGQCATGNDWRDKRSELNSRAWCEQWMEETPAVLPNPFFFIPHRIPELEWIYSCRLGGVLFDRCRISHLVGVQAPAELSSRMNDWSQFVLENSLREKENSRK